MKKRTVFIAAAVAFSSLFALACAKFTGQDRAAKPAEPAKVDASAQKAGADEGWMAEAERFIENDMMQARLDKGQASLLQPSQDLRASLGEQGLVVTSAGLRAAQALKEPGALADSRVQPSPTPGAQDWAFSFRTQRYGRGDAMQAVSYGAPQVRDKRMSVQAGGITEWYESRPEGIEQGFTIKARPLGQGEVRIESAVVAGCSMQQDGQAVVLKQDGQEVLRYGSLKVMDAQGRELKSRLQLKDCRITLAYEDEGAKYPVVVDPLIVQPALSVAGETGSFGWSVAGAGDVNGDGYGDVIIGTFNSNMAYIAYGSANGLGSLSALSVAGETGSFGWSVASAGDVNGDGYGDVIIGAASTNRAYLAYGSVGGLGSPSAISVAGETGRFGNSVASAGDVNGDGFGDVIIGADYSNQAYLAYGNASGLGIPSAISVTGETGRFGNSVASAGDVNGDGYGDVIIGTYSSNKAYIAYGSASGLDSPSAISVAGETGQFGRSVASAGDVNGDGYGDVIVGVVGTGRSYIAYGSAGGLGSPSVVSVAGYSVASAGDVNGDGYGDVIIGIPFNIAYIAYGSVGGLGSPSAISVAGETGYFGRAVASAGDVNGDGYGDVIIGAYGSNKAYIAYGSASGLDSPSPAISVAGETGQFGRSVASAGDVNGDGYGDVIIGAYASNKAYVAYGSASGVGSLNAISVAGETGNFGRTVASAGDVNGDGYGDVIIGALGSNKAYIAYGSASGLGSPSAVSVAGETGYFGRSVASAGDVNGDGYGDVIIGAYGSNQAYIAYGSAGGLGSPSAISVAASLFGYSVASAGDVNGDGYGDVIIGAYGSNQAYVAYGSASGLGSPSAISVAGETGYFGVSVASAGDVNGDGYGDVIIGAYGSSMSYIAYGSAGGLGSPSAISVAGETGNFGVSVASAGDVNGDGYGDVIIGAYNSNLSYVAFGSAGGLGSPSAISVTGETGHFGYSVAGAGDVNGDGFGDVVIGAYGSNTSYLFQGNTAGMARQAQQLVAAGTRPVCPVDAVSYAAGATSFMVKAKKFGSPHGRAWVRLCVEAKPWNQAFSATGLVHSGFVDSTPSASGQTVQVLVNGLQAQTAYHWRYRMECVPLNSRPNAALFYGPWLYPQKAGLSGNPDLRTGAVPTPSATVTASPTVSPTSTGTPVGTALPTATATPAFMLSGLGRTVLAPVPCRVGRPLCAYFTQAPASTSWQVFNIAGGLAAEASFGAQYAHCLDTTGLAPGVYLVRLTRIEAGGGKLVETQKVALIR